MATVHQSDLAAWTRCPTQFMYTKAGFPRRQTSALSYGSVMHYAMEIFERLRADPDVSTETATSIAIDTFQYFWHPANIHEVADPVEVWLRGQTYSGLRDRGTETIQKYAQEVQFDDCTLLATEYSFQIPIPGTWDEELAQPHVLAGTIDRLALRLYKGKPIVSVEDYKTGAQHTYLRHNLQITGYCLATHLPEFWTGWNGEDGYGPDDGTALHERFTDYARRGTWINLKTVKFVSAGFRGPFDYGRFALAVQQVLASQKADIYPLSLSGEVCESCEFRDICAGTGVAEDSHGAPGTYLPADVYNQKRVAGR